MRSKTIPFAAGTFTKALLWAAAVFAFAFFSSGRAFAQDTQAVVLPPVQTASTEEVCSLGLGASTDSVGIPGPEESGFESDGPSSMAIDASGVVYVLDAFKFRVLVIEGGKLKSAFRYPEGETKNVKFFGRDIAVSSKDGKIYILNHTLKNIFVMDKSGKIEGDINLSAQIKSPQKMDLDAGENNILVRDEEDFRVVAYSKAGEVTGKIDGAMISTIADRGGFLYALGEFDRSGRDIVLMDPMKDRQPKVFGRIANTVADFDAYDYQLVGADAAGNVFALAIEQVKFDVSRTILYKFSPEGAVVSRHVIPDFWGNPLAQPTRQFAVSPNGGVYAFDCELKDGKFRIHKLKF